MEVRSCSSVGCDVSSKTHPHIKLFRFPQSVGSRLEDWKRVAGLKENHKGSSARLCSRHFTSKDFYDSKRTRLVRGTVPSFPYGPLSPSGEEYEPEKTADREVADKRPMEIVENHVTIINDAPASSPEELIQTIEFENPFDSSDDTSSVTCVSETCEVRSVEDLGPVRLKFVQLNRKLKFVQPNKRKLKLVESNKIKLH